MIVYDPVIQHLDLNPDYFTDVLRLDLIHPEISGNKWFKLKKNLDRAVQQNQTTILTFGGAFSNHIAAAANACKQSGLKSIGVIRGERIEPLNTTLLKAQQDGMRLHFVDRASYAAKHTPAFQLKLTQLLGNFYLIPEGGNNAEGVVGCMEILKPEWNYDYVFCACGTGTTYSGLLASVGPLTKIIGVNVLKGDNTMASEVRFLLSQVLRHSEFVIKGNEALEENGIDSHSIISSYSFRGYAKFDQQLIDFKNQFEKRNNMPLDYIYTCKLFYAVDDLIKRRKVPANSKILIVHSGGLQGNQGFEKRYKIKTPAV